MSDPPPTEGVIICDECGTMNDAERFQCKDCGVGLGRGSTTPVRWIQAVGAVSVLLAFPTFVTVFVSAAAALQLRRRAPLSAAILGLSSLIAVAVWMARWY